MYKKLLLGMASLALVGLAFVPSLPAQAHSASNYYGSTKWNSNTVLYVYHLHENNGFWNDNAVTSAQDAIQNWNSAVSGYNPTFVWQGQTDNSCSAGGTRIILDYAPFTNNDLGTDDGFTLTQQWPCVDIEIQSQLDPGDSWHRADNGSLGSGEHSLAGVIAHELGHATGFGKFGATNEHFTDNTACPNNDWANYNTMCSGWALGQEFKMVTLESHDIHTVENEYGP